MRRNLLFAFLLLFLIFSLLLAQDKVLILNTATVIPSSPVEWTFFNTQALPNGDLQLLSKDTSPVFTNDLLLEFEQEPLTDSAGKWKVSREGLLQLSPQEKKFGNRSLYVKAPNGKITLAPALSTIFTPNTVLGSFSIDFWIKPQLAANGEIIFLWKGSRQNGKNWYTQQISGIVLQNKLRINFINIFFNNNKEQVINLAALTPIAPDTWAHYLVTYNSENGLLQLIKDGKPEAIIYLTATGKENGKLFTGLMGTTINFDLAPNYTGFIDNFRITEGVLEQVNEKRYPLDGGIAVSPVIDLGAKDSLITTIKPNIVGDAKQQVVISYRLSNSAQTWTDRDWKLLINDSYKKDKGRYLQLKYELYPDPLGMTSPIIKQTLIEYEQNQLPLPPKNITAISGNGTITLYWTPSNEPDVKGYVIYYGRESGKYFGTDAKEGKSPIIIYGASISSFALTNLQNGSLYFICIAAFDDEAAVQIGEFSQEVTARPMRIVP